MTSRLLHAQKRRLAVRQKYSIVLKNLKNALYRKEAGAGVANVTK